MYVVGGRCAWLASCSLPTLLMAVMSKPFRVIFSHFPLAAPPDFSLSGSLKSTQGESGALKVVASVGAERGEVIQTSYQPERGRERENTV